MKNLWRITSTAFLLVVLLATQTVVHAQTLSPEGDLLLEEGQSLDTFLGSSPDALEGALSCFDYYTFGSVKTTLTTNLPAVVSGTSIAITGTLTNENPYPIVDGSLFVKVFKSRGATNDGNGPDLVDQFFVTENLTIPAGVTVPVSFVWNVPSYAESGEYRVATYFTEANKFNLSGLSFTDDITGASLPFTVVGEVPSGVGFDKSAVTLNDQPHLFAAGMQQAAETAPVAIVAPIENTTESEQTVRVTWKIYHWDAQTESNLLTEETQIVTIPAQSAAPATYTVTDTEHPVYFAVATADWEDTQSIINVRFVRENINKLRINYPGVLSFPLEAGQTNTLFSCVHNIGSTDVVNGGTLTLALFDRAGSLIHEYTYEGGITSAMMAVAEEFIPDMNHDYVRLVASLTQNNALVDEAQLIFDCNDIDPALCFPADANADGNSYATTSFNYTYLFTVLGMLLVVILSVFFIYLRLHQVTKKNDDYTTSQY